jgi:O-antigen ligase
LFAALAVSALVLALSEQRRRTFWLLAGVAALTGVVTSAARGPLVAVAVGTVVFAALNVTKPLRLLGFLTIFLIGALALRFTMTLNDSTRAVLSMVEGKALSLVDARDYRRGTVAGRLSFWREMWRDFQENPFVGHGALAYKRYSVEDVVSENFPLEVLHSAGLAGGVALMGCFGGPILRGWRWSRRGAPEDRRVIVALLAGFCGLLVASLTNPVGWAALFWVLLALLASAAKIAQRHGRSVSPGRDAPLRSVASHQPAKSQAAPACRDRAPRPCHCVVGESCRVRAAAAWLDDGADPASCFQAAASADRFDVISPFRLGQLLEGCDRADDAIGAYRSAAGVEYLKIRVSEEALGNGQCEAARRQARIAVALAPRSWAVQYQAGMVGAYCDPRDYTAAVAAFEEAVRLGYPDPYVWTRVAHAYSMAGRPSEALDTLQRHHQENGLALAIMGEALMARARYAEAVTALVAATVREPRNPSFWTSLGQAYWLAGEPDRARASWRHALSLAPGFAPAVGALARHP